MTSDQRMVEAKMRKGRITEFQQVLANRAIAMAQARASGQLHRASMELETGQDSKIDTGQQDKQGAPRQVDNMFGSQPK